MMTGLLLVAFWIVAVAFALFVSRFSRGRSRGFTILETYLIHSVVVTNLGFLINFLKSSHQAWAETALFSTSLGLIMVALGGGVGIILMRADRAWSGTTPIGVSSDIPYAVSILSSIVVLSAVLLYFRLLGYVPMVQALRQLRTTGYTRGLMNTLRVARDPYVNPDARHIPLQGFMELIRYEGLPIVAVWFLWFYRQRTRRVLSLAMLVICALLAVFAGQRWPLQNLLAVLIIFYSWVEDDAVRYRRFMKRAARMAIVAGVILSILLGRASDSWLGIPAMILVGTVDLLVRIVVGNVDVPFLSYSIFPYQRPWLLGGSWVQNTMAYLPGPGASFPVTFSQIVTGTSAGFTAPPDFYTEAYINFGLPGVVFVCFAWGVMLGILQRLWAQDGVGLLDASLMALSTMVLGFSSSTGGSAVIGLLIVVVFIKTVVWLLKSVISTNNHIHDSSSRALT